MSSDDELDCLGRDHEDALKCSFEAMVAGIEHVYTGAREDFLSYDDALEVAFESVVQHACKANQEHCG